MLIELYLEAVLADAVLADEVWELWNEELISTNVAALAWYILAVCADA